MPTICSMCGRTSGKCQSCIKADSLIADLDAIARHVDPHELGLPVIGEREKMRAVVMRHMGLTPGDASTTEGQP